jgi:hypothetical protein
VLALHKIDNGFESALPGIVGQRGIVDTLDRREDRGFLGHNEPSPVRVEGKCAGWSQRRNKGRSASPKRLNRSQPIGQMSDATSIEERQRDACLGARQEITSNLS